jgi:hypothetical protein
MKSLSHTMIPVFLSIICILFPSTSRADCASPIGIAGSLNYEDSTKTQTICDGTDWKIITEIDVAPAGAKKSLQIANDPGACNTEKTGRLRFNGTNQWTYCDGNTWQILKRNNPGGYLVQSSTTWNGNLGGLAGADAKCLTDLTNNDWKGKATAGILSAGRVKAFLCSGSSCNNLSPNTPYILSTSGDPAAGGVGFVTNANGQGFGHQFYNDSGGAIWRSNTDFWTNRGTLNDELWSNTPKGGNHCANWSSTTGNGHKGNSSGNGERYRWDNGTSSCGSTLYLACVVEP